MVTPYSKHNHHAMVMSGVETASEEAIPQSMFCIPNDRSGCAPWKGGAFQWV
jgi:hypothetical protein